MVWGSGIFCIVFLGHDMGELAGIRVLFFVALLAWDLFFGGCFDLAFSHCDRELVLQDGSFSLNVSVVTRLDSIAAVNLVCIMKTSAGSC